MANLETIFSVVVGGVLTLLGTLLANYLEYRAKNREWRKERVQERFEQVYRYLIASREFAGLVSTPAFLTSEIIESGYAVSWLKLMSDHLEEWKSLGHAISARDLLIEDEQALEGLQRIDELRLWFFIEYQSIGFYLEYQNRLPSDQKEKLFQDIAKKQKSLEDKRHELEEITLKVKARMDQLLDRL